MSRVLFDLRYSARKFIRTPWLTLALLLTIALGIGSNVSVYGFARGLTRPYTGIIPETGQGLSRIATLFSFAAGAVFFIACANVVSFMLGRALARSYETSVRVALGARRPQLARELLSDSIVISLAGGALGLLLADWTTHIVPAFLFDQDAEQLVFAPSLFNIVAASTACVAITILCGLIPLFATRADQPDSILRRESAGASKNMRRLRLCLVVAQMTSCCILVISTAFLFDGFRAALQTSAGRRLGNPILATVQAQPTTGIAYFQRVQQAAQTMPGISPLAWTSRLPGTHPTWHSFRIEPTGLPLRDITMDIAWFTASSLKFLTLLPNQGRLFGLEDSTCRVAVVNKEGAAQLFGNNTAGRTIQDAAGQLVEIIGVVDDTTMHAAKPNPPTIYYNYANQTGLPPIRTARAHFRAPIQSQLTAAELDTNVVSQSYFQAMRLSLTAGREFTGDRMPGLCRIGIINQEAANLYFAGKPVGAAVIDERGVRTAIVGVVRSKPLGVFQRHAEPAIYFPMAQDWLPRMTLIAAARQPNDPTLADLRRRIESVPANGPAPVVITTLATHLAHTALAPLRIATIIIGASAATALMLSILGLFSALSDAARQRRRELAIRIAFGAHRWAVIRRVLREGGQLACAGALIGILASLALSRLLTRIAYGSSPPLWVWLAAPLTLLLAVVIASLLPARRASLVNPITIMRDN